MLDYLYLCATHLVRTGFHCYQIREAFLRETATMHPLDIREAHGPLAECNLHGLSLQQPQ